MVVEVVIRLELPQLWAAGMGHVVPQEEVDGVLLVRVSVGVAVEPPYGGHQILREGGKRSPWGRCLAVYNMNQWVLSMELWHAAVEQRVLVSLFRCHKFACLIITLLCVVASQPPFLRSKNTLWASEPPYWSEMVFPIISYMDMKMKERLLSVAVGQH